MNENEGAKEILWLLGFQEAVSFTEPNRILWITLSAGHRLFTSLHVNELNPIDFYHTSHHGNSIEFVGHQGIA